MSRLIEGGKPEQLIARHVRRWELQQRQSRQTPTPPTLVNRAVIALSRQPGSGGAAVAREVADRLGWHVFDRELVEYIAAQAHARERVIASIDERVRSLMEEWVRSVLDRNYLSPHTYLRHLMSVVLTIAHHGQAVLVGRGCHLIVNPLTTLRVRVIAPLERRLATVARLQGLDPKAARRQVHHDDAERAAFIRAHFHRDIDDPADYDMVLNLAALDIKSGAAVVIGALRGKFGDPGVLLNPPSVIQPSR